MEGSRHLEKILPFLSQRPPQILCLQEAFAQDVALLAQALNAQAVFAPMCLMTQFTPEEKTFSGEWGVAIITPFPILKKVQAKYFGMDEELPTNQSGNPNRAHRVYLQANVDTPLGEIAVATTHFTWTPDGQPSAEQWEHLPRLQKLLQEHSPDIFCGDLNSARGTNGILDRLAQTWNDAIPPEIHTSIDGQLHRAGPLPFMVDALFTTPRVQTNNVSMQSGLSDHQAVLADIALAP